MSKQIPVDLPIQAALEGKEEAWEQLIATFTAKLLAIVSRRLAGAAEVEDIVQEIFARAWESRATATLPNFRPFL
jgi:DNA-directed RNA polymerase specialized sigma24 family protein